MVKGNSNYSYTIKAMQNNSQAYMMPREEFMRLVKSSYQSWNVLKEDVSEKDKLFFERLFTYKPKHGREHVNSVEERD
jgi:hypothetical protein